LFAARQWVCLALAKLLEHNETAKQMAINAGAHEILAAAFADPVPEVRFHWPERRGRTSHWLAEADFSVHFV
jgi:hypothetical protein